MTALRALPEPRPERVRTYRLTKISTVKGRPIEWLLPGRIPMGALTVLAGRPGLGKSQLTIALASVVSRNADVLMIGAEDGLADTVRPRLMAVDADLERVSSFDPKWEDDPDLLPAALPTDVPLIAEAVVSTGASLVVIDPFAAHLSPELNSNNDHSLRQATRPLAKMAVDTGAAVIVVAHLKKDRTGSPLDWIGGSIGLTGAARSVLLFGRDPQDVDWNTRHLVHVKCNGAPLAPAMKCSVESIEVEDDGRYIQTSRVNPGEDDPHFHARDLE